MVGKAKLTPEQRKANRQAQVRAWMDKNPGYNQQHYLKNKQHYKEQLQKKYRETKENEPWRLMLRNVRARAKERGLEFDLDAEFLKSIWTDTCPVLGIPLKSAVHPSGGTRHSSRSKPHDNSPTLDRIDSSKGYTKNNVIIMSYRANMIKNCGTIQEHELIVEFMRKRSPL